MGPHGCKEQLDPGFNVTKTLSLSTWRFCYFLGGQSLHGGSKMVTISLAYVLSTYHFANGGKECLLSSNSTKSPG